MNPFPVAILAGGLGTRLRPITGSVPKSLVEINGEPFIAHQLRRLGGSGIGEIVLCIGFLGDQIREFVGDGSQFGMHVQYSDDTPSPLGTGGAIRKALPLLPESFFVLYGDSYLTCSFEAVQAAFVASGKEGLMTVFGNKGKWDVSNVEFAAGRVLAYDKNNRTSRMQHIDYGLGVFRRTAFENYGLDEPLDLCRVYQELLTRDELAAWEVSERFYEVGSFKGLRELCKFLRLEDEKSDLE